MRRLRYLLGIATIIIITLGSCRKWEGSEENLSDSNLMENLVVDKNFDWETSIDIEFKITTAYSGVINISSQNGEISYHKGFYNVVNPTYDVSVNLPKHIDKILINGQLVGISGTTVSVDLDAENFQFKNEIIQKSTLTENRVAYWNFNENAGNVLGDSEGDNDGIIYDAVWTEGIDGSALYFDGTYDYVDISFGNGFNLPTYTISTWAKVTDWGNFWDGIISIYNNSENRVDIELWNDGTIHAYIRADNQWQVQLASDQIAIGEWNNFTISVNTITKTANFYQNGLLKATANNFDYPVGVLSNFNIGRRDATGNCFNGSIDEIEVYDKALTAEEISSIYLDNDIYQNPQNYISNWRLNENSGSVATDSEFSNHGTISGAQWVSGVEGSALMFGGINDNVNIPNASNLNVSDEITIMVWVKTQENKTAKIAQKGDYDGHSVYQDIWNGWKCNIRLATNFSHSINWGAGIPVLNEWYHIALTYNGESLRFFVNGELKNQKEVSGDLKINNRDFSIGSDNGAQKFFNGSIDDVRMYGSALNQTEIQYIFHNSGNTGNTDSDGDGIKDSEDDFPNDPTKAFSNYLPAAGYGSLAFEDLWPGKGDYDFNDLILDYQFTTITNAQNKVAEIVGSFVVRAIGASLRNGFGFQFPNNNIDENNITISGTNIQDGYITLNVNGTEADQNKPTIIVFDNAKNSLQASSGFGVNVEPSAPYVEPDTIKVSMIFTPNIYVASDIDLINFNPFLIIDEIRGKEIHLANYSPTNLVDDSYFGTMHDDSNPSTGKYYKTEYNLPWAIKISESYDYTIEKAEITIAYLKFYEWAESSGASYPNWFQNEVGYRNEANIYPN